MVSRDPTTELSGEPRSIWIERSESPSFEPLAGSLAIDVAVVGAGIAGLTTALLLAEADKSVAVIDADRVGSGVTGHSTAKVTAAHGLAYDQLASSVGEERARGYADANVAAVDRVEALADAYDIDCSLERLDAYTYTRSAEKRAAVESEVRVAKRLGVPASFAENVPVPFDTEGAIRVPDQVQFNPAAYVEGLAGALLKHGSFVFEATKAVELDSGRRQTVRTVTTDGADSDGAIEARDVVIASHFPVFDPALYFARMYPKRSYLLAARVEEVPEAMGYEIGGPYDYRSTRPYPTDDGPGMLIGGEGHKAGQGGDTIERYRRLERYARENFDAKEIEFRWSTQDYVTVDGLPYVGRLSPAHDRTYVATGFGAWGMTNGTAAGVLLSDLIRGEDTHWERTFDPSRATISASTKTFAEENANVGRRFASDWASGLRTGSTDSIEPGEGDVMRIDGKPTAVARDENGALHSVSAVCTHLDCIVQWNNGEGTWDCPCHGSRFGVDGDLIVGPAVEDLPPRETDD